MKILEIQHFLGLWGLSRAEIFRFEIFHLQLKSAGLRMFSIGLHQISTGGTLTNRVYPIRFRQGYSWVCKRCTLFMLIHMSLPVAMKISFCELAILSLWFIIVLNKVCRLLFYLDFVRWIVHIFLTFFKNRTFQLQSLCWFSWLFVVDQFR